MCLVTANTNKMREDFEALSSSLIEVHPYRQSSRSTGLNANVSIVNFKTGRQSSGVELRWNPKEYFLKLSKE